MSDLKGTPGGNVFRRDQLYVDDGDGTHSEVRSANLRIWDTNTLSWRKMTAADFGGGTLPASLGQKAMAASLAVVIASDQSSIPVTQTTSPWVTNDPGLPDTLGQKTAANSTSVTLASDQGTHPVSAETGTIYNGATALTPAFAFANVAASQTDSAIVAAVTAKKIRVIAAICVTGATATNLTFNSKPGGAGSAVSMLFANAANGGAVLPYNPVGWFETVAGEGLSVTTGAGSTTGIQCVYVAV